jgi:hypothetical protein
VRSLSPLALGAVLLASARAFAGSALVLSPPTSLGPIPAGTYDDAGKRLGEAVLSYDRGDDGLLYMRAATSVEGGPSNDLNAVFAETEDGRGVRVLREASQSRDSDGNPMVLVEIDHQKGVARCTPPGAKPEEAEVLELPENDRVGNTILGLLFQPLVRGVVDRVEFQAFLCRGGARLVNFVAVKATGRLRTSPDRVVEVRYGPDLGRMVSWLASVVVPKLRFWFDAERGEYLAHRMPLFGGGPEVVVAREGVSAGALQP